MTLELRRQELKLLLLFTEGKSLPAARGLAPCTHTMTPTGALGQHTL